MDTLSKRDGRRVPLDNAKLCQSIRRAAEASGHGDPSLAQELAEVVSQLLVAEPDAPRSTERVAELTGLVLRETGHVSWAEAYLNFREQRRRQRARLILSGPLTAKRSVGFSKGPLLQALVREAQLNQGLAEEVAAAVEDKLLRSGLRRVSSSLLRELADAELLERGHTAALRRHALVGIPRAAIQDWMFHGAAQHTRHPGRLRGLLADAILEQYSLDHLYTSSASEAHRAGRIHIEDSAQSPLLHSALLDLRVLLERGIDAAGCRLSPPRNLWQWLNNLRVGLEFARAHCARRVGLPALEWLAAPLVAEGLCSPEELADALLEILRTPLAHSAAELVLCFYPEPPDFLAALRGLAERPRHDCAALQAAADALRSGLLRGIASNQVRVVVRAAPRPDELASQLRALPSPVRIYQRDRRRLSRAEGVCGLPGPAATPRALLRRAVSGVACVNLPRMACEAGPGDWDGFLERAEEAVTQSLQGLGRRRRLQQALFGRPDLPLWNLGQSDWTPLDVEDSVSVLAPTGLSQAIELLTGECPSENREALKLAARLLQAMQKRARASGRKLGLHSLLEPAASLEAAERFQALDTELGLPVAGAYERLWGSRLSPRQRHTKLEARLGLAGWQTA